MADLPICPDCGRPSWRPGPHFDEAVHCLAWHCDLQPQAPRKFLIACRDRLITRLRAQLVEASAKTEGQCCATAVAARDGQIAELRVQVDRLVSNAKRAVKVLNG